jgi:phenylalanyl-tRNA synthetase alpha chain
LPNLKCPNDQKKEFGQVINLLKLLLKKKSKSIQEALEKRRVKVLW